MLYNFQGHSLLSPFEYLRGNFILPDSTNHIFVYLVFNLRKLLYLILGHGSGQREWGENGCNFLTA